MMCYSFASHKLFLYILYIVWFRMNVKRAKRINHLFFMVSAFNLSVYNINHSVFCTYRRFRILQFFALSDKKYM